MIHALHGNFGLPSDWAAALPPGRPAKAWDLWEIRRHHPEARTLTGFAAWFNLQIAALPDTGPHLLAGYSLGGRLALHVLLDRPALWSQVLLLSTHPGLTTEAERPPRLAHDLAWQERCLTSPWETVLHDWNAQPVLAGTPAETAPGSTEPWRREIASAFQDWSLGAQENLLPLLHSCPVPTHWIAGEEDGKFSALAKAAAQQMPEASYQILPGAGHRLLTSHPAVVRDWFRE